MSKPSLIWACPCYGDIDPQVLGSHLAAMAHATEVSTITHVGITDRVMVAAARQRIAEEALEKDADYIFWADSDVILPSGVVARLLGHRKEITSGLYFQRYAPHWPLMMSRVPDKHYKAEEAHNWVAVWPRGLIAVGAVGFGCVLVATQIFRNIAKPWFVYDEKGGEDVRFCVMARQAGYQVFVDTEVVCGHLGDRPAITEINYETYIKDHPELLDGKLSEVQFMP